MSSNKATSRTKAEVKVIQETGRIIWTTIAKLDPRGTDEQVSRAMCIVNEVVHAMAQGKHITSQKAYSFAMRRLLLEREQE